MEKKIVILLIISAVIIILAWGIFSFLNNSKSGYYKEGSKIIYRVSGISTDEVINADVKTFEVMPNTEGLLARDRNRAYFRGMALPSDTDITSLQPLLINGKWTNNFLKDKSKVYHGHSPLDLSNPVKFQILEDGYAKDDQNVYFQSIRLIGVNPLTFKVLGGLYATDGHKVFYTSSHIPEADAASFVVNLDEDYARDKNFVYRFEKAGQIIDENFVENK